jgi:hypothetical protein
MNLPHLALPGTDLIMLTIKRTCANKIISRALELDSKPLVAVLRAGADDCEPCSNVQQLQNLLDEYSPAIIVYNQHEEAINLINLLQLPDAQIFIEIRQETKGVLGLHAIRNIGGQQETLELVYR